MTKNEDDLKTEDDLKNEDDLKTEDDLKNEKDVKNEDDIKNENDLKTEDDLQKNLTTPNLKIITCNFFCWALPSTATGQLILNQKCHQVSKPEMELHMINIIYAALHIRAQTEKTTSLCIDD